MHVGAIAAVAADEPLLFHEERPEVQRHVAPGGRAAGHDRSAAREAIETFHQHFAADVFHDDVHAAFVRDAAHFGGPFRIVGIDDEFRAELLRQFSLRRRWNPC